MRVDAETEYLNVPAYAVDECLKIASNGESVES
jgi:hypothetical protein